MYLILSAIRGSGHQAQLKKLISGQGIKVQFLDHQNNFVCIRVSKGQQQAVEFYFVKFPPTSMFVDSFSILTMKLVIN